PGNEVRLRYAYLIKCQDVIKDAAGSVTELHCTYDPATRGGNTPDGRKVKATIHWVSEQHAIKAEARLYDHLFTTERPNGVAEGVDGRTTTTPNSLVKATALVEPSLATAKPGALYQFERVGYFCADPDSKLGHPVFNRTVTLKDSWAKIEKKGG